MAQVISGIAPSPGTDIFFVPALTVSVNRDLDSRVDGVCTN